MRVLGLRCLDPDYPLSIEAQLRKSEWFRTTIYPEFDRLAKELTKPGEAVEFRFTILEYSLVQAYPGFELYRVELAPLIALSTDAGVRIPTLLPEHLRVTYMNSN